MLFTILGAITGLAGPIAQITGQIKDKQIALRRADSEDEKNLLQAEMEALHDRRAVLVAEAGSRLNAIIRASMAVPVSILLWKLLVYDKALGEWTHGYTDPLGSDLWKVVAAVIAFYFLYDIVARRSK